MSLEENQNLCHHFSHDILWLSEKIQFKALLELWNYSSLRVVLATSLSCPKVIFASHLCKLSWIDNCIIFGWLRPFGEKINDIDLANLSFSQVGGELCRGAVVSVLPGWLSRNFATEDGERVGQNFLFLIVRQLSLTSFASVQLHSFNFHMSMVL